MKYYCWLQYYDQDTFIQTNSDEIMFHQGHKHGVKPTEQDWLDCLVNLVIKVNEIRRGKNTGLADLASEVISQGAEPKTRSEK